jgi:formylglycine-generating enzyme required for sulfatase activity
MADESAVGDHKLKVAAISLFACVIVATIGAIGWYYQDFLKDQYHWRLVIRPSVLTAAQEKEKAAKPGSDFKECANGCPTMIVVRAGTFLMGSPEGKDNGDDQERPQHEVTIAKPFAVGRTDVTFAAWDICVAAGACPKVSDAGWGRGDRPVVLVNWEESAFGLYDMHGNVWQWIEDCYHNSYRGAPSNGSQWVEDCSEDKRVVRGGSWFSTADYVRSAIRSSYSHVDNWVSVSRGRLPPEFFLVASQPSLSSVPVSRIISPATGSNARHSEVLTLIRPERAPDR